MKYLNTMPDLNDALQKWNSYLQQEKNLSPNTLRAYNIDMENFINFYNDFHNSKPSIDSLSEVDLIDFRSWLSEKAMAGILPDSRARSIAGVRNFFHFMDKIGVMNNASIDILGSPKKAKKLPRPINKDIIFSILDMAEENAKDDWVGKRDRAIFTLLYACGLRISEALNLNYEDISENSDTLIIRGKGNKERVVPLLKIAKESIFAYEKLCPFNFEKGKAIFVGKRGDRINPGVVERNLREIRYMLGLPNSVTPHAFRHSFASHILADGADLKSIQDILGHSSLQTTQKYTKIDEEQLKKMYEKCHPRK